MGKLRFANRNEMSIEEEKENLEYGLPSHEDMQRQGKPVKFGTAPFIYQIDGNAVSYTHLTLPTKRIV